MSKSKSARKPKLVSPVRIEQDELERLAQQNEQIQDEVEQESAAVKSKPAAVAVVKKRKEEPKPAPVDDDDDGDDAAAAVEEEDDDGEEDYVEEEEEEDEEEKPQRKPVAKAKPAVVSASVKSAKRPLKEVKKQSKAATVNNDEEEDAGDDGAPPAKKAKLSQVALIQAAAATVYPPTGKALDTKLLSRTEVSMRELFSRAKGYRIWSEQLNTEHMSVVRSVMKAEKKAQRASEGYDVKNMKDASVYLNCIFSSLPPNEKILSKFVPYLANLREPYSVLCMTPPMRLNWVRLSGLGTYDKPKWAPKHKSEAQHEFNLTIGAYDSDRVGAGGSDPSALAFRDEQSRVWDFVAREIIRSKDIATENHTDCENDIKDDQGDRSLPYAQRFVRHYLDKYTRPVADRKEFKFSCPMFNKVTKTMKEEFVKRPYQAPSPEMQEIYEKQDVVYNDLPVVRLKTEQEVQDSSSTDSSPFVYIPFTERSMIKSGDLGMCLFQESIVESYENKSSCKFKPVLLIWISKGMEQEAKQSEQSTKSFVVAPTQVTKPMSHDETGSESYEHVGASE
jgi:hypothetical protein